MATVTFTSTDQQSEIYILVDSLSAWLKEQEQQPVRQGTTHFVYGADGLCAVTVTLDGE